MYGHDWVKPESMACSLQCEVVKISTHWLGQQAIEDEPIIIHYFYLH